MWAVLKYDKKYLNVLKSEFLKKLGKNCRFYQPKIKYDKYFKNKLVQKELLLLGNYLFLYHNNLKCEKFLKNLKYIKGLKYFLNGHSRSQVEINHFINFCNEAEDKNGYIKKSFINLISNGYYKFKTGPFADKIFKLLNLNREYIEIMLGNLKTKVKYKNYIVEPV